MEYFAVIDIEQRDDTLLQMKKKFYKNCLEPVYLYVPPPVMQEKALFNTNINGLLEVMQITLKLLSAVMPHCAEDLHQPFLTAYCFTFRQTHLVLDYQVAHKYS